jgi:hypothetical protein
VITEEGIMEIDVEYTIKVDMKSSNIENILKTYTNQIPVLFELFTGQVLIAFAQKYMDEGILADMIGCSRVTRKSFRGTEVTRIMTPFGMTTLPQLQVVNQDTGSRVYITRKLLGIEPCKRIPLITKKYLGLMGALAPLRVVNKFMSLFTGTTVSLMAIVRSIRDTAKTIELGIDTIETNEFEADGTGIPILNAGKRGKELEILAQRTKAGRIRIAGMVLSSYKQGWKMLFEPLKDSLKVFGSIFLVTDGDTSPLAAIEGVTVILQRCLFHIAHETKYTLWQDKVKRKSKKWLYILAKILEITNVRRVWEAPEVAANIIKWKRNQFTRLIHYCDKNKFTHTASYLRSAQQDIFSGIERRISGGTTSLLERVMRTLNQRINVAKWTDQSALAVAKIRAAYYYNGWNVG